MVLIDAYPLVPKTSNGKYPITGIKKRKTSISQEEEKVAIKSLLIPGGAL
jgi:hypothetical protein